MDPFDLALATNRIRQPVQAIPDNAVNPFDSSRDEDFRELVRDRVGHAFSPKKLVSLSIAGGIANASGVKIERSERGQSPAKNNPAVKYSAWAGLLHYGIIAEISLRQSGSE
jgi:hypothetical protein